MVIILFKGIALPKYVPCIANYNNYIIHGEINVLESFKQIHINYTVIQLCFWVAPMIDDENPVGADDNETADEERVIVDKIIEAIEEFVNEEIEELIVDIHDVYDGIIWWSRE